MKPSPAFIARHVAAECFDRPFVSNEQAHAQMMDVILRLCPGADEAHIAKVTRMIGIMAAVERGYIRP